MDSNSTGFDPLATYDDGSCPVVFHGCTDSTAANYREIANRDDDTCTYKGCMATVALNYDESATIQGRCTLPVYGCTDSTASNYYEDANVDSGSCKYLGCTV